MNTSMDSLSIEIESVAKSSNTQVDLLITKLDNLRTSLQNVIKESEGFSKLKKDIENVGNSAITRNLKKPTDATSFTSDKQAVESIGVSGDYSKFAKLKSTIKTTNSELKQYVLTNGDVLTVTKKTTNGTDSYAASLKKLGDSAKDSSSKLDSFRKFNVKTTALFAGAIYGIKRLASGMSNFVKEAANYEESMNLFMVTLGDKAEDASKWVEKFSNALYLDPASVMQYMGQFNSLTKGLGVGADKAYIMSKNLTQLTYDLASFKNLSYDTAFRKLQSGMSGELEPLRNVGVALSQATLQELAYSMGIEKRVADMNEAEKAQLRYIQILKSSTEWQGDMAATLVTPANALRILQQQFTLLARAIGKVFIPILMEVIPYVMVLTQALTKLANKLASLLGYKIQDVDYSRISSGLSGISDGVQDIGDNAADTAKKLNTMLAPFDELNVVQNEMDKSGAGSGLGGAGGGLDLPLPEYDALDNLNDKLSKKMAEAKENLKKMLPIIGALGAAFAAWKIGKSVANFIKWYDSLPGAGKAAARIGLGVALSIIGTGLKLKGDKDVLNEKTLLQGIAEQLGGSFTLGAGVALITKNISLGVVISGISLIHSGGKTAAHGNAKQGLLGTIEQLLGVGSVAGASFKITGGNPVITLGVTAAVTWANVFFELADLIKMKPTLEELSDAFKTLGKDIYDFANTYPGIKAIIDGIINMNPLTKIIKKVADAIINLKEVTKKLSDAWETAKRELPEKWENLKSSASEKFENIKTTISTKWNNIIVDTTNKWTAIKNDFSNKLNDMKTATSEKFENIRTTIVDKWTNAKNWLSNNIGNATFWKNKFKGILDGAGSILNDLRNRFSNWSAHLKTPHLNWHSDGVKVRGVLKKALETLNLPTSLPSLSVSWYAQGGFPKDGEFFVANENGPEMIGRIGNRSAVANNDQIETSLTNALLTALNSYDFGGDKAPTTIYIGNKKVYEGYEDYINGENDRYGTNTIRI